jgi:hypothetical protein
VFYFLGNVKVSQLERHLSKIPNISFINASIKIEKNEIEYCLIEKEYVVCLKCQLYLLQEEVELCHVIRLPLQVDPEIIHKGKHGFLLQQNIERNEVLYLSKVFFLLFNFFH